MKKILIIHPSETITTMVSRLVKRLGQKVFVSANLPEGKDKVRSIRPDIVLTEVMFDGFNESKVFEEIQSIREEGFSGIILAFTSLPPPDREEFQRIGFDDWIGKDELNLKEIIQNFLKF